jgi:hypothetical protein
MVVAYYNSTPHTTTGYTPFYLMFGRKSSLPTDFLLGTTEGCSTNWVTDHQQRLKSAYEVASRNTQQSQEKSRKIYNLKAKDWTLPIGSHVYTLDHGRVGRNKIGDQYSDDIYIILDRQGAVYTVKRNDGTGKVKYLNRKELRLVPEQPNVLESAVKPNVRKDNNWMAQDKGHASVQETSSPESSSDESSEDDLSFAISTRQLRRSGRRGAGTHRNPFNEPRSVLQC